jgi:hypothetical protein
VTAFHQAWSDPWLGNNHILLANLMDQLHAPPTDRALKPYNHSIPVIQSSGMGKSRLVDEVACMKFCFPFNLRNPDPHGQYGIGSLNYRQRTWLDLHCPAYPPSDHCISHFFQEPGYEDAIERKYTAFFVALFECAVDEVELALDGISSTSSSITERWRDYLSSGATAFAVGDNRQKFYQAVTDLAKKVQILFTKPTQTNLLCTQYARTPMTIGATAKLLPALTLIYHLS